MAILVTGGTGKTSSRLAHQLHDAGKPFVVASRRGPEAASAGMQAVKFDWNDESTFDNPFQHQFPNGERITAVYLVAPGADMAPMIKFFDLAHGKYGVKRFVMLGGSSARKSDSIFGQIWRHITDARADFTIIRAVWFMEQFSEQQYLESIKNENQFSTACEDGKSGFIAANDIAAMAFSLLTSPEHKHENVVAVGAENLTHDEVASTFTQVLNRQIAHVKVSPDEKTRRTIAAGVPEHVAKFMTYLDIETANGNVGAVWDDGHQLAAELMGRPPQSFKSFIEQNKAVWQ